MDRDRKPRLAVWKFASCDGCQLSLLDCEDEFLEIVRALEIANFPEASRSVVRGPYDISLVEGSISTEHDAERIHQVRRASRTLITIGACATSGGIQALRNFADLPRLARDVYPAAGQIEALGKSTPVADHVFVDYQLRGCPVNKRQLLEVVSAFLNNRKPSVSTHSVCSECKRKSVVCVAVAARTPCLGPVTHAGCGAICPSYGRGCYGCYGPKEAPNTGALSARWSSQGVPQADIMRAFRAFTAYADPFRKESEAHE